MFICVCKCVLKKVTGDLDTWRSAVDKTARAGVLASRPDRPRPPVPCLGTCGPTSCLCVVWYLSILGPQVAVEWGDDAHTMQTASGLTRRNLQGEAIAPFSR